MAQEDNVIALASRRSPESGQVIDEAASNAVGCVYRITGHAATASNVIIAPQSTGYEAHTHFDGSMTVGAEGVEDFKNLFESMGRGDVRLHALGLYVMYSAYGAVFRSLARDADQHSHVEMLRLSLVAQTEATGLNARASIHNVEGELAGWYAARKARKTVVDLADMQMKSEGGLTMSRKETLHTQIISAAQEGLRNMNHYKGEDQSGRKRVLGHFALSLGGASDRLERGIDKILTDRRKR